MPRITSTQSLLLSAALGGLLLSSPALAQSGGGRGERPQPQVRPERPEPVARAIVNPAEIEAWVRTMVRGLGHSNPVIQQSAAQAIISVGRPARSILQELVDGPDEELAARALRITEQIDRNIDEAARREMESTLGRILQNYEPEQRRVVRTAMRDYETRHREVMQPLREEGTTPEALRSAHARLRAALMQELTTALSEEDATAVADALERRVQSARPGARPGRPAAEEGRPGSGDTGRRPQRPGRRAGPDRP